VIGLLLLKHIYGLSDEGVCERWVHHPYFQYFTGEEFFQHEFPHERSDLSNWRKRLGDKLELLLAESLRVAHASGALRTKDLARVTVDTTVQPKAITFPTDAKLLHAAIRGLNRLARRHGVRLRQSYLRVAKHAAMMAGRYAHAKQFNRHRRQLRILRTRLGRIIRDIGRKIVGQPALQEAFQWPLARASQIPNQFLLAFGGGTDDHEQALRIIFEPGLDVDAIGPDIDISLGREVAIAPAGVHVASTQASFRRAMAEADSPPASLPSRAANASSKSPVEMPFR
jgi:hypothetical protein